MVVRPRVAAHADVPIAGGGAGTGGRLMRRSRRSERVIQRDYILLVLRAERAHADVVRTVLPEHIVSQQGIGELSASPIHGRSTRSIMARGADDRRGTLIKIRNQSRTVLDAHQSGDLRTRSRRG